MEILTFKITNDVPEKNIMNMNRIHYEYNRGLFLYYHFTLSNYDHSMNYLQLNKKLRTRLSKYEFYSNEHEGLIRRMKTLCPKAIEDFGLI